MIHQLDVEAPENFDAEVETCLETIRAQFVDPTSKKGPSQMIGIAMSALTTLLTRLNKDAADLAEAGILLQAVALSSVIYHLSTYSPGEWMHEVKSDFERAYGAIGLLLKLDDKQPTDAAAPAPG